MLDRSRETKLEEAILETKILVDCVADQLFGALESNSTMPSPAEIERLLTLMLITQRRAGDIFREFHGHDHGSVQP